MITTLTHLTRHLARKTYLNADTKESTYFFAGPEFGVNKGRPTEIRRALYGLKSSGTRFQSHLAQSLRDLGYKSCLADPDVWLKPVWKADGTKYYENILCYVDNALAPSEHPEKVIKSLQATYKLKEESVGNSISGRKSVSTTFRAQMGNEFQKVHKGSNPRCEYGTGKGRQAPSEQDQDTNDTVLQTRNGPEP
jgi:hypothetical protein